jgi:hypothetical protein
LFSFRAFRTYIQRHKYTVRIIIPVIESQPFVTDINRCYQKFQHGDRANLCWTLYSSVLYEVIYFYAWLSTTPRSNMREWRYSSTLVKHQTSALVHDELSAVHSGRYNATERVPGTRWVGGWIKPGSSLDIVTRRKILSHAGNRITFVRPVFRHSTDFRVIKCTSLSVLLQTPDFCGGHPVQNGSGAHPASYPMGTRGSFPGGKAAGAWSWPLASILCRGHECVELYLQSPNTSSWCGA